jgi:hypothetical protein
MKDPSSIQFQNIARYKVGSADIVCGMYNAKNSYGGYVGFKEFIVMDNTIFIREEKNPAVFDDAAKFFCQNKN